MFAAGKMHAGEEENNDTEEEVDYLALAAILLQDGHYDRAASVLSEIDLKTVGEEFDLPRYHMLYGLVHLKAGDHARAEKQLKAAIKAGQSDPMVYVFLAQASFGIQKYEQVIEALDKAGKAAAKLPGTFLLRAQSEWRLGNKPAAYGALQDGLNAYPDNAEMKKNRVLLLVDMGLYQQAVQEGKEYLTLKEATAEDHVAIAEALIRGLEYDKAILILEDARLRYPLEEQVTVQLARAYLEAGHPATAARLFREASHNNPKFTLDAAELFRRAGRLAQALRVNEKVLDQKAKIRQKLGILIELERYEEAIALKPRLSRLGLLGEDAVVYALGYSFFKTGKFEDAERQLEQISDVSLFEKSIQLRKAMGTCRAAGWLCR